MDRLEEIAQKNNVPIMQKEGIEFLKKCIKENNVKSILEIGCAIGYSAIQMASVSEDVHVTTIERNEDYYKQALSNIHSYGFQDQIDVIYGDALNVNITGKFDMIFIDAAKAQYIKFFEKYKTNLNKHGIIVSDNLNFHGLTDNPENITSKNLKALVRKINNYKEFLKTNDEFTTTFFNIGDGVSLSKR